ncbi:sigma-54-dependent Fis family transcriptional regulator [candidate division KSB1 bacterium]|nr:sigma-54-dependent Fis family transcriptional regulator [candidate division KSB1 bacterium]
MNTSPSVIAIVDSEKLRRQIHRITKRIDCELFHDSSLNALLERLDIEMFDIIIMTSTIAREHDSREMEKLFNRLAVKAPRSQFICLTEPEDIELVGLTFHLESVHFVKLPVSDEEMRILLENAYNRIEEIAPEIARSGDDRMGQIVGASYPMHTVYQQIRRAASTDISVMLMGETGTGKDLLAQAIHRLSARNKGPYIPVNLGALPGELIASELFGHEKGAFTGASRQHRGKFEQARRGTLFLDEIESIDNKTQVSLLRILEEKRFTRIGGDQAIRSNARLIVATNDDLEALVHRGVFRKDLYYRLDVFRISLPPLRKRYGDIPLLVSEFVAKFSNELGVKINSISPEVFQSFEAYDWPGNIRELKNVIHRAVLLCDAGIITHDHLPPRFAKTIHKKPAIEFEIGTTLEEVERRMILRALEVAGNNRKAAAELLGISRRAIYNKLKKHSIE